LQDQVIRDIPSKRAFEDLLGASGIAETDTVVLYGDNHNWFAAHGFWLFRIYGHRLVRLLDGGRLKWQSEPGRPFTTGTTRTVPRRYRAKAPDHSIRAQIQEVLQAVQLSSQNLVDVRTPEEFSGSVIAPPGLSETAQRGGHIPGAVNIPWSLAVQPDGTFKSVDDLRRIYLNDYGLVPSRPSIVYCRSGECSSHTWFVLTYLLGFENVKNYDGSWTEYGSMIGLPIDRMTREFVMA